MDNRRNEIEARKNEIREKMNEMQSSFNSLNKIVNAIFYFVFFLLALFIILQIIFGFSLIFYHQEIYDFFVSNLDFLEFNKENHNKAFNIFTKFSGVVIMFLGFCESIVYSLMFLFFKKIQKAM